MGKKKPEGEGKRPVGRPATEVPTEPFCCRAPLTMVSAYKRLARITGATKAGTELLRASEDHLLRMYRFVRRNPDSPLIRDVTGHEVEAFLKAVEMYAKEAHLPLPAEGDDDD